MVKVAGKRKLEPSTFLVKMKHMTMFGNKMDVILLTGNCIVVHFPDWMIQSMHCSCVYRGLLEYTKDPDPSQGEEGAPFVMLWELTCELGYMSNFWNMLYLSDMYDDADWWSVSLGDEDDDDSEQHDGWSAVVIQCPCDNDKVMSESN